MESVEEQHERLQYLNKSRLAPTPIFMETDVISSKNVLPEKLIPIRIQVTVDMQHFEDAFLWNVNEKRITPEWFAYALCEDLNLPVAFHAPISASMRAQIEQGRAELDKQEKLLEQQQHLSSARQLSSSSHSQSQLQSSSSPSSQSSAPHLVVIKLNLTMNGVSLQDKIAWDPENPSNSPEVITLHQS